MEVSGEKNCGNCKHYTVFYTKHSGGFHKLMSGNCMRSRRIGCKSSYKEVSCKCDKWEVCKVTEILCKKNIHSILLSIVERVDNMLQVLECETYELTSTDSKEVKLQ